MNSSSIVLSFMLAGVIFLMGHHLIAGPVIYQDAGLSVMNKQVSTIQSVNNNLVKPPIKTQL